MLISNNIVIFIRILLIINASFLTFFLIYLKKSMRDIIFINFLAAYAYILYEAAFGNILLPEN
jgi:hypothetical protein